MDFDLLPAPKLYIKVSDKPKVLSPKSSSSACFLPSGDCDKFAALRNLELQIVGKGKLKMEEQEKTPEISYQIRVKPGRAGTDPNAPDWEVLELEDGQVMNTADIYDNLTEAEAHQIAGMWRQKKAEAEATPSEAIN